MRPKAALRAAALGAALLALVSCTHQLQVSTSPGVGPRLTLEPSGFDHLEGWHDDDVAAALPAFAKSCAAMARLPAATKLGIGGTVADWQTPCVHAASVPPGDGNAARHFLESDFDLFLVGNYGSALGLFTGYYEPELRGARVRGGAFTVPLLKRPPDLVSVDLGTFSAALKGERIAGRVVDGRLVPYPARAEIERGVLDRQHLEFLWVDSAVDAFFLSVQGSGRVRLPNGSYVNVEYDGSNGQPYVAIGRVLVERGALPPDQVSLIAIRAWLATHPGEAQALMDENPSYEFFRESNAAGAIGAEGVVLTAGRSLAIDSTFLPLGVPLWLDIAQGGVTTRRLVIAQDIGGAIRSPVRGDLFCGFGPEAEAQAGAMRATGSYYVLLPRGLARPAS